MVFHDFSIPVVYAMAFLSMALNKVVDDNRIYDGRLSEVVHNLLKLPHHIFSRLSGYASSDFLISLLVSSYFSFSSTSSHLGFFSDKCPCSTYHSHLKA